MRNVRFCKRPTLEIVNSKVAKQLIGRRAFFELLHPTFKQDAIFWARKQECVHELEIELPANH
jgi:hypothetical protein